MVTTISDKVTIQDFFPLPDKGLAEESGRHVPKVKMRTDESGNPVVVSKDFILSLLSLAIGKPFFLDGNLGQSVDVRI
ncbi:MAG: hypothetical protein JXQ30_11605 [Spirochaetes bacterium]|nr:hypothetical protein [Spirochaetota bacterium]